MLLTFFLGFLGILSHTLVKMDSTSKDLKTLNENILSVKVFLLLEWRNILLSIILIVVYSFFKPEIFAYKPQAEKFEKIIDFAVGVLGAYAFQLLLGKSKNYVRQLMKDNATATATAENN